LRRRAAADQRNAHALSDIAGQCVPQFRHARGAMVGDVDHDIANQQPTLGCRPIGQQRRDQKAASAGLGGRAGPRAGD
jgi:hypothetical protein